MKTLKLDKLTVARAAIATFVPLAKADGTYKRAQVRTPAFWTLKFEGLTISVVENVLRLHTDASTSCILDIWPEGEHKVLSVSWEPDRPWQPLHISTFKRGDWMQVLMDIQTAQPDD